ncbi:MAG: hypothetical protein AB1439_11340 [candidate division FCPU426 bacterium]
MELAHAAAAGVAAKPLPILPPLPPAPRIRLGERPLVTITKRLARQPRFWVMLGSVLAVLIAMPWLGMQTVKWASQPAAKTDPFKVDDEIKKKFEKLVDQALADKLEWGRDVLRNRLPTRFPEELIMEVDKQKTEAKYDNRKKNTATFAIIISYHFDDDHPKAIRWYPGTFYFEKRNEEWRLVGDNWIKESELILE